MSRNNNPVGIVIHIDEELQQDQISMLETSLGSDAGVQKVHVNRNRKHLILVDYIPSIIRAKEVIDYVKNKGYHAILVGMI